MTAAAHFAPSYRDARARFLAEAQAAGLAVHSHPHPLPGRDGEPLAMDVARLGEPDAAAVLLVSSACHGVEGFCGSGVQRACWPMRRCWRRRKPGVWRWCSSTR
jgi:hypothetical protein